MKDYKDWAHLNDEGKAEFGDIFPDGIVPILSMLPIVFEHPNLDTPERAYLLRGSDLIEDQLVKLVEKLAKKFNDPDKKDEIKKYILANEIPIREKLTSGTGTKRIYMYMDFNEFEDEYDDEEDWDEEQDWEDEDDWW